MADRFCKTCGKPLEPNAKFCISCGAAVSQAARPSSGPAQTGGQAAKPSLRWVAPVSCAVMALVVIGVAALFLSPKGSDGEKKTASYRDYVSVSAIPSFPVSAAPGGSGGSGSGSDMTDVLNAYAEDYAQRHPQSETLVPAQTPAPAQTGSGIKETSSTKYVQDPVAYLGQYLAWKEGTSKDGYYVEFYGSPEHYALIQAYVAALTDGGHNLTVADQYEETYNTDFYGRQTFYDWAIDYTGSATVGQRFTSPWSKTEGNVTIFGSVKYRDGTFQANVWIAQDLEVVDLGLRYGGSAIPYQGSAGGSPSGGASDITVRQRCPYCDHGQVPCNRCDGTGTITKREANTRYDGVGSGPAFYEVETTCDKCWGHKTVDCSHCGGTGYIG